MNDINAVLTNEEVENLIQFLVKDIAEELDYSVAQKEVIEAMANMASVDHDYFMNTIKGRLGVSGSVFLGFKTPLALILELTGLDWVRTEHPCVKHDCVAYKATGMKGKLGIVPLNMLSDEVEIMLADRKNTGTYTAEIEYHAEDDFLLATDEVWLITGYEQGRMCMFTVHPGEPIRPSTLTQVPSRVINAPEAVELGLEYAKVVWGYNK